MISRSHRDWIRVIFTQAHIHASASAIRHRNTVSVSFLLDDRFATIVHLLSEVSYRCGGALFVLLF